MKCKSFIRVNRYEKRSFFASYNTQWLIRLINCIWSAIVIGNQDRMLQFTSRAILFTNNNHRLLSIINFCMRNKIAEFFKFKTQQQTLYRIQRKKTAPHRNSKSVRQTARDSTTRKRKPSESTHTKNAVYLTKINTGSPRHTFRFHWSLHDRSRFAFPIEAIGGLSLEGASIYRSNYLRSGTP